MSELQGSLLLVLHPDLHFEMQCHQGHAWTAPFKSKLAKKSCLLCKRMERTQRKQFFRAADEASRRLLSEEQDKLF